jgi:hypothetical protein
MDMVGLSIRQLPDYSYQVIGIVEKRGNQVLRVLKPEIFLSVLMV